ncbi:MAG: hypothetical protein ACREPN_06690 [Rudaea sp.]
MPYTGITAPTAYYDNEGPSFDPNNHIRYPTEYERCQMQHLSPDLGKPENKGATNYLTGDPMIGADKFTVTYSPIENWLMRGDVREDDITPIGYFFAPERCGEPDPDPWLNGNVKGIRVVNHFYDPINDAVLGSGCGLSPDGVCHKSVDWALGFVDSFATPPVIDTNRANHFTYEDARENMWLALTSETGFAPPPAYNTALRAADAQERLYRWATVFRSLGDVIHLLQDGAQPQHVRNDDHSPFTSGERQAYEGYTNARVVGIDLAKVNSYVTEFFKAIPSNYSLPPLVTGDYPVVTFAMPLRFFTTRLGTDSTNPAMVNADSRYGLMDYTNRGFFTGGTLPGSTGVDFVEPSPTIDSSYTAVSQPCVAGASLAGSVTNLTCMHLTHTVLDNVDSGYIDTLPQGFSQPPLLLESAWSQVVPGSPIPRPHNGYMVGLEEFQTMANLTIPRAIGYSAGMLNYFFRGTIDVEPINYGALAVLNQGAVHSMNQYGYPCVGSTPSDGCAIFGFTTLRLKIHNTTPSITESGSGTVVAQSMIATTAGTPDFSNPNSGNAYLVAVARYHRNACYTPAMDGLPVKTYAGTTTNPPTTCTAGSVRTPYQEISVSQSIAVSAATLNAASASAVAFDFSNDPIPVNATDLFVQVVYRGALGQEQEGIAVGTLDVSEPTFAAFWNNTDYFVNDSDQWIHDTTAPYILSTVNSLIVCAGGQKAYSFTGTPGNEISYPTPPSAPDNPGAVRLAVLFSPTNMSTHRVSLSARSFTSSQQLPDYVYGSLSDIRQANVENLPDAALTTPASGCATTDPTQSACWRFDSVAQRRGLVWASAGDWWPLHVQTANAQNTPDVDSVPLPAFTTATFIQGGTVDFNSPTLAACPF